MAILYYFPGVRDKNASALARKLPYALKGVSGFSVGFQSKDGPDGGAGAVVTVGTPPADVHIGYNADPAVQTWRKIPGGEQWVGIYTAYPPAAELVRPDALSGHLVELGDGGQWMIPNARAVMESGGELTGHSCMLPTSTGVGEDGEWTSEGVTPRYAKLWETACKWWDQVAATASESDGKVEFDFAGLNDAALLALSANYRVSKAEVGLLGLFSDQSARDILLALVDWPTVAAWLKKKATESPEAVS